LPGRRPSLDPDGGAAVLSPGFVSGLMVLVLPNSIL
jgi:hypothetical protein